MFNQTTKVQTSEVSNKVLVPPQQPGYLLREKIEAKRDVAIARLNQIRKEHGQDQISQVTVDQLCSGSRGVYAVLSDISHVDPYKGIQLRGYSIPELIALLPKAKGSDLPLMGGLYHLLLTGSLPSDDEAEKMEAEWFARSEVPQYVIDLLRGLPKDSHPMTLFSQAILAMQNESRFAAAYRKGLAKEDYWKATLEDSLNLTAKLPVIAAFIYNLKYGNGEFVAPQPDLDWSANFGYMIGKINDQGYYDLSRLFFLIHADHEGANASAHTARLVASTLSDVYYASSAGLSALAGPLHGLANQECLRWLRGVLDYFGEVPSKEALTEFVLQNLNDGKVIPGYGHAVLRVTDPRFTVQFKYAQTCMPDDQLFSLVKQVYEVVPSILFKLGKVKNPWPNVDAINGALQYHFGVTQHDFYTVLFGVSRIMGFTAQITWDRLLMQPIERPKSITIDMLAAQVGASH
jgi:citrate synthase